MATYHGYQNINHLSYDTWRLATLGNAYDVDGIPTSQPFQCWDYCAQLWHQYGLTLITKAGGGTAQDCWNISRNLNAVTPFIAVYHKAQIKRGDVVVFGNTQGTGTGHIAFADEDYNGTNDLKCVGQNQGAPMVTLNTLDLAGFLGVFRNTDWSSSPEPDDDEKKKKKFPWAVAWKHWGNFIKH